MRIKCTKRSKILLIALLFITSIVIWYPIIVGYSIVLTGLLLLKLWLLLDVIRWQLNKLDVLKSYLCKHETKGLKGVDYVGRNDDLKVPNKKLNRFLKGCGLLKLIISAFVIYILQPQYYDVWIRLINYIIAITIYLLIVSKIVTFILHRFILTKYDWLMYFDDDEILSTKPDIFKIERHEIINRFLKVYSVVIALCVLGFSRIYNELYIYGAFKGMENYYLKGYENWFIKMVFSINLLNIRDASSYLNQLLSNIFISLQSIYFTVITFATVGFGDIVPISIHSRIICTTQVAIGIALVVILLTAFTDKIDLQPFQWKSKLKADREKRSCD